MAYTTIDDPTKYFDTTIWTGDGGAKTITGLNHKPDLIWTKTRSVGYNHMISDSSRGFNANSELGSNSTSAEGGLSAETYGYKSGHTADGWTMVDGTDTNDSQEDGNTNQPSVTYVGWTWAANGGTTTTNDASATGVGDIDSVYQANTTAGFSIVTYTHTGNDDRVAHGLGATPKVVIVKERGGAGSWYYVTTQIDGSLEYLLLEGTAAKGSLGYSVHTSTTFPSMQFDNTDTAVAYCFAEKQGYSKFGSYKGNGSTNGPFVYTGFKPAMIIKKVTSGTGDWHISDNKQNSYNAFDNALRPNVNNGTETGNTVDFLSNGFKLRNTGGSWNSNGSTYIYMAFAEHPFVSSEGVPATAG